MTGYGTAYVGVRVAILGLFEKHVELFLGLDRNHLLDVQERVPFR
jgi:hypothetical protein